MSRIALCLLIAALVGCANEDDAPAPDSARLVMTSPVRAADPHLARLSGTVRARFETPVSFQVDGRILERRVDAGDRVEPDQILFRLDPRDFAQAVSVARADLEAARAELETDKAETRRNRDLLDREFISEQVFERVQLAEKSARERVDAAQARLEQARNRLGYTELAATRGGTLIEVTGEPGQVVAAGQPLGVIAQSGDSEVEVFLPERFGVPQSGRVVQGGTIMGKLSLREAAGAADQTTRTWKARYSLSGTDTEELNATASNVPLRLGSVVKVALDADGNGGDVVEVPVGAINERGQGPQVWIIRDGRAEPVRIVLLDMDAENARIMGDLEVGMQVISLGTHLLQSGMPVRELK
ncbi:MAG TPA: efflux RND transporter periplasmic adaptor subunit [Wenzhouxiangellaceae bacterium]|nr:efflux RND transporter periplasmic adaptor subunit [Wenzhouxiangellaceae bacterium]